MDDRYHGFRLPDCEGDVLAYAEHSSDVIDP